MTEPKQRRTAKLFRARVQALYDSSEKQLNESGNKLTQLRTEANTLHGLLLDFQQKYDAAKRRYDDTHELYQHRSARAEIMRELLKEFGNEPDE